MIKALYIILAGATVLIGFVLYLGLYFAFGPLPIPVAATGDVGTVTSVGMSAPSGFSTVHVWGDPGTIATAEIRVLADGMWIPIAQIVDPSETGQLWRGPQAEKIKVVVVAIASGNVHWSLRG
jgi:hypothetical protein